MICHKIQLTNQPSHSDGKESVTYHPSFQVGPLDYIQCLYWADTFINICWLVRVSLCFFFFLSRLTVVEGNNLLMCSTLLPQQCLLYLALMVCGIGDEWLYSCCSVRCCFQDLFNVTHRIPSVSLESWCSLHTKVLTWPQFGRNPILFY